MHIFVKEKKTPTNRSTYTLIICINYKILIHKVLIDSIKLGVYFGLLLFISSCTRDTISEQDVLDAALIRQIDRESPTRSADYYILPSSDELNQIPQDPQNPLTPEKVALGNMLFYETGLATDARYTSGIGTFSCSTCHVPSKGFRPGTFQGVADGGLGFGVAGENRVRDSNYQEDEMDVQSARPLSLVNVAFVTNTSWNGQFGSDGANVGTENLWHQSEAIERNSLGFSALETQNFDGLEVHRMVTTKEFLDEYGFTEMYDNAFPELSEEMRYSNFATSFALSAYLRTIMSNQAPFQEWLKGNSQAMSLSEKRGATLFFGKANCSNCHYEQNLGSGEFHRLGVKDLYQRPSFNTSISDRRNLGRGGFTMNEEDYYKFKVPTVYNAVDDPHYFHGSSKESIEDVIDYKIAAISENDRVATETLSSKFKPLSLTEEERDDLITFIKVSLRDPDLERYMTSRVLSGNCFPNNDPLSQSDLGCN
jgi:cytochrome c peroxidase